MQTPTPQTQQAPQPEDAIMRDIEKRILMQGVTQTDAGMSFLRWLCRICSWNKPIMDMGHAYQRDVWLTIRRHVDPEKLAKIEFEELKAEQELIDYYIREETMPTPPKEDVISSPAVST